MKVYVSTGTVQVVIDRPHYDLAARDALLLALKRSGHKVQLGRRIRVSEVGFESKDAKEIETMFFLKKHGLLDHFGGTS